MAKIPGVPIIHAVITPNCRTVERPHLHSDPRMAAFEEAVERAREKYRQHINACDPSVLKRQNLRLAVLAETDRTPDDTGGPDE